eukprot:SAG11_NODE_5954_length_1425_cov_5.387632_3_plen_72_part_00
MTEAHQRAQGGAAAEPVQPLVVPGAAWGGAEWIVAHMPGAARSVTPAAYVRFLGLLTRAMMHCPEKPHGRM